MGAQLLQLPQLCESKRWLRLELVLHAKHKSGIRCAIDLQKPHREISQFSWQLAHQLDVAFPSLLPLAWPVPHLLSKYPYPLRAFFQSFCAYEADDHRGFLQVHAAFLHVPGQRADPACARSRHHLLNKKFQNLVLIEVNHAMFRWPRPTQQLCRGLLFLRLLDPEQWLC